MRRRSRPSLRTMPEMGTIAYSPDGQTLAVTAPPQAGRSSGTWPRCRPGRTYAFSRDAGKDASGPLSPGRRPGLLARWKDAGRGPVGARASAGGVTLWDFWPRARGPYLGMDAGVILAVAFSPGRQDPVGATRGWATGSGSGTCRPEPSEGTRSPGRPLVRPAPVAFRAGRQDPRARRGMTAGSRSGTSPRVPPASPSLKWHLKAILRAAFHPGGRFLRLGRLARGRSSLWDLRNRASPIAAV